MRLSSKIFAGQFTYYSDGSRSNPVSYIFAKDIDGDHAEEVFFVSFETQFNTPENYSNTSVHIFGWKNNQFQEITNQWLPLDSNQVEGVGDIAFGDFNGDDRIDVFLSAYTDMEHPVNAYALLNQGDHFIKQNLGSHTWMHAVASADINHDGLDDVIVAGYSSFPQFLGSANGLIPYQGMVGSSGVVLDDFLGDGTITAIFSDNGRGLDDTYLYRLIVNDTNRSIEFQRISQLPGPRLEALNTPAQYLSEDGYSVISSHDIRLRSIDFNHDGLKDVVLFSYRYNAPSDNSIHRSEIQFLLNQGGGHFIDATENYRTNYDLTGMVGYYPQILDVNLDGREDIFVSQPDWMPSYNSTTLLLQDNLNHFVDSYRDQFRAAIDGGQGIIVSGPNNQKYLISEGRYSWSDPFTKIYLQEIFFPERDTDEFLHGTDLADSIHGLGGNDVFMGFSDGGLVDPDYLFGDNSLDVSVYRGSISEYLVHYNTELSKFVIEDLENNRDGFDILSNIERLHFVIADEITGANTLGLDNSSSDTAGSAFLLYLAALGRTPDLEGLGFWIYHLDRGLTLENAAQFFIESPEFRATYGPNVTNSQFIDLLYWNILNRIGDQEGLDFWNAGLGQGLIGRAELLTGFATAPEFFQNHAHLLENGIPFIEWGLG